MNSPRLLALVALSLPASTAQAASYAASVAIAPGQSAELIVQYTGDGLSTDSELRFDLGSDYLSASSASGADSSDICLIESGRRLRVVPRSGFSTPLAAGSYCRFQLQLADDLPSGTSQIDFQLLGVECAAPGNLEVTPCEVSNLAFQVDVLGRSQSIVFDPVTDLRVGASVTLTASGGGSGNPIVFSSLTPATCTVVDDSLTALHAGNGNCTVAANQAGNDDYAAATEVNLIISIGQAEQLIDFELTAALVVGDSAQLTASGGGSGNPVQFEVSTPETCSVDGNTLQALHAGSCGVVATQAGNADYTAAAAVLRSIDIGKASQSLQFQPLAELLVGTTAPVGVAGGGSGNPIELASDTPEVCALSGPQLLAVAVGSCRLSANQAGNDDYLPAPTATLELQVLEADAELPPVPLTTETTEPSLEAQVSGDGRFVVFESLDPKLHAPCPGVANPPPLCGPQRDSCPPTGTLYVYRLNTELACTDLVSLDDGQAVIKMRASSKGEVADPMLGKPSLSADGSLVAFSADLAAVGKLHGETASKAALRRKQGGIGLLLRLMLTGSTQAPPPPTGIAQPVQLGSDQGDGTRPQVAPGAGSVAFTGLLGGQNAVFLTQFKPSGAETLCVSCKAAADADQTDPNQFVQPFDGMAQNAAVSANGAVVAYETSEKQPGGSAPACDNDPGNSGQTRLVLRNMLTGVVRVVSQPQGVPCQPGSATKPRLDYSGGKLVFQSNQPLTAGAGTRNEAYLFDLGSGQLQQVSTAADGSQVDAASGEPTLSGDGRSIAFTSRAKLGFGPALAPEAPDVTHVIVRDLRSNTVRRLSRTEDGSSVNGDSSRPSLSYTGDLVVFDSAASNLNADDGNGGTRDVFLRGNPTVRQVVFDNSFE